MEDYKQITEPDPKGFQVRIVRNKKEHSRYFAHNQWGGRAKALNGARSWRDQMLISLGKINGNLSEKTINSRKRTTGIRGVSRSLQYDKRRDFHYLVYSVHWRKKGKACTKTFYLGRIGEVDADQELHAFRTAVRFRREYELSQEKNEVIYPERYKLWKTCRLYEIREVLLFDSNRAEEALSV